MNDSAHVLFNDRHVILLQCLWPKLGLLEEVSDCGGAIESIGAA